MKEKELWRDKGYAGGLYSAALPFFNSGHEHYLVNTETGEHRTIHVRSNQTLSEAIASGEQWTQDESVENENERFSSEI